MFTYNQGRQADSIGAYTLRVKLPDPGRVKSKPVRAAQERLGLLVAKQRDLLMLGAQADSELAAARAGVEAQANAELEEKKGAKLAEAVERKSDAKRQVAQFHELVPRMQTKVDKAASDLVATWRDDRKDWSQALQQEARDDAVRLVGLAADLGRLIVDFECTLGVLAGYDTNTIDPYKSVASTAVHYIAMDLGVARTALGEAITKLIDRKMI